MKPSDDFRNSIEAYIKKQAETDPLFAPCLEKPGKNIDDCCTYILNWAKDSGISGASDAEVFGQAMHYYQEDNINVGKPVNCKVVVNHVVEAEPVVLTEEEKAAARKTALDLEVLRQRELLQKKPAQKKVESVESPTLF